ncbi:UNKNOWN [Stylonychia lemnae]|uniref:Transmembrane protein n=1 Tax=Stylonychia lemnae TaxID=5949 RepID=A0A078B2J1_STYLE|nr:UNKNOWN [Stylonychia lemnae]|eukprot:CDW88760.1 UNKNOWN [Stylonychia lemnae]
MKVDKIPSFGGSIVCLDCGNFYITNATMNNSIAQSGGILYLELTEQRKEKYTSQNEYTVKIIQSMFANSKSLSVGGAIHLNNQFRVLFQSNTLNYNYAITYGGGLYMECVSPFDCKYSMQGTNKFKNNYANSSGGAIYWGDVQPILLPGSNYQFESNKALIYADNIGSYPQKLVSLTKEQYQAQLLRANANSAVANNRRLRDLQVLNSSTSSSQDQQRSGNTLPTMYIGLADAMGQIVGTESSKKLDVSLKSTLSNGANTMKYQATIAGTTTFYSLNGVYVIKDIIFTGAPGEKYQLSIVSDGIDPDKPANKELLLQQSQNSTIIDFDLNISLRECQVGEKFTDAGACDPCPAEKSYSLVKMLEPGQCVTCPTSKAVCSGGSNIGPQPGYWRKNNVTSTFIKCFNYGACLGMVPPQNDPQGQCYTGYAGILCTDCNPGYSLTGSFQCAKCPEYAQNVLRILAILIVGVVVIAFMIRSTLQGAADVKNITSVFQKILLNHIQLIVLTASFNFSWPQIVVNYFKTSETVGEASNQIFSIDCFLNEDKGFGLNDESQKNGQRVQQFGIRIFYIKLAMFGILPFLLMLISSLFWFILYHKPSDKHIRKTKSISSIVLLLFLVHPNIVKSVFNSFNCIDIDGDSRLKNDLEILCYSGQHNIWSFGVGFPTRSNYTVFMSINITKQPFQTKSLNELETLSLITSLLSIFCGVFFIVSVDSTDIQSGQQTSDSQEIHTMLVKKFPKIYIFLFLCNNKHKYELELEAANIKEENEILREKYQDQMRQLSEMCDTGEILLNNRNLEKLLSHFNKDTLLKIIRKTKNPIIEQNDSKQKKRVQRTNKSQIEDSKILTHSVKEVGLRKQHKHKSDYEKLQILSKEFAEKQTDFQSISQKNANDQKKIKASFNSQIRTLTNVDTDKSIVLFNQNSSSRFNTDSQREDIIVTESGLIEESDLDTKNDFENQSNDQSQQKQHKEDRFYSQLENQIAGIEHQFIPVKTKKIKKKTRSQIQIDNRSQIDQFIQEKKVNLENEDNLQVYKKQKQRGPQKKKFQFLAESPREGNLYQKLREEQLKSLDKQIKLKDESILAEEIEEISLNEQNNEDNSGSSQDQYPYELDDQKSIQYVKRSWGEIQLGNFTNLNDKQQQIRRNMKSQTNFNFQ